MAYYGVHKSSPQLRIPSHVTPVHIPTPDLTLQAQNVRVFISLFAYSSRTDKLICTKLGKFIPSDQGEEERSKL
jgi:hypothetical protein